MIYQNLESTFQVEDKKFLFFSVSAFSLFTLTIIKIPIIKRNMKIKKKYFKNNFTLLCPAYRLYKNQSHANHQFKPKICGLYVI